MSKQIQQSRQGLSTHNLYLETILRYSFGVIGLDQDKKIQFINSISTM
jgi:nitrogen fixation/metabolism regulation signal transduction histidine kinase